MPCGAIRSEIDSDHVGTEMGAVECCRGLIFMITLPGGEVNSSIMDSLRMQLRDLGYKNIRSTNTWQSILQKFFRPLKRQTYIFFQFDTIKSRLIFKRKVSRGLHYQDSVIIICQVQKPQLSRMTENKLSRNWILASAKHTCPRAGFSDVCNSIREALADSRGFSDISRISCCRKISQEVTKNPENSWKQFSWLSLRFVYFNCLQIWYTIVSLIDGLPQILIR